MTKDKKRNFFSFFSFKNKKQILKKEDNHSKDLIILKKKPINLFNKEDVSQKEKKNYISNINHNVKKKNCNLFMRLKNSLYKTSKKFSINFINLFSKKNINCSIFEELEEKLLLADIGLDTTDYIINNIKKKINDIEINNFNCIYTILKQEMLTILKKTEKPFLNNQNYVPFVILIVGVNGVGKTTTIGKLAKKYKLQGKSVMLAAGDTFRSAAVEQLQKWGELNDIIVISSPIQKVDPASVIFNSLEHALANKIDILIIDTAGRLHNKFDLMQELKKIIRVIKKKISLAPHEILLIIDACTGQNAINQTKLFHENLGLTGIILTKVDGTAKGGIIFPIAHNFKIPIKYIGIGEKELDLIKFNSINFVDVLFEKR
ncbi:Signal recognition particle receptor FtsY [Buchnera aphidicola (Eriosoma grossulariae)]|uniref:signal recognition particle-docking protein FtsY n=1 Tax=Buchnera aphidicola TaxID=9 RepID=UPI0034648A03